MSSACSVLLRGGYRQPVVNAHCFAGAATRRHRGTVEPHTRFPLSGSRRNQPCYRAGSVSGMRQEFDGRSPVGKGIGAEDARGDYCAGTRDLNAVRNRTISERAASWIWIGCSYINRPVRNAFESPRSTHRATIRGGCARHGCLESRLDAAGRIHRKLARFSHGPRNSRTLASRAQGLRVISRPH